MQKEVFRVLYLKVHLRLYECAFTPWLCPYCIRLIQANNSSTYLFSRWEKELDNENCMKHKTSMSRTAGCCCCCPSCQSAPYVCCGLVCEHLYLSCNFKAGWLLTLTQYATGTHTHTLFPWHHGWEISPQLKKVLVLTFSRDRLQGPSPLPSTHGHTGRFLDHFFFTEQSKASEDLSSQVCVMSLLWSTKANRSRWAFLSQVFSAVKHKDDASVTVYMWIQCFSTLLHWNWRKSQNK